MIQHLLLMMVVPPLLLLGAPILPLLRGLPRPVLQHWARPLVRLYGLQRLGRFLPSFGWFACLYSEQRRLACPRLYELALRSEFWHDVQHVFFLSTGLLFWPVVQPGRAGCAGRGGQ